LPSRISIAGNNKGEISVPVSGTTDNSTGLIAMYFSGVITLEEINAAHDEIANSVQKNIGYVEINFQDKDSKFHNIDIGSMRVIKEQVVEKFEKNQIIRHKVGAILLGKEASIIYPLWRSMVEPDDKIKTKYQVFDTIESACAWLGVDLESTINLLKKIGFRG
jgi:hypothetical protein